MPKSQEKRRNFAFPAMVAASAMALGTTGDVGEKVREKARVQFNDLIEAPEPKRVMRPERGSKPPKWAIAGPARDLMTHSDLPECDRKTDDYGAYDSPQKLRGHWENHNGETMEGLLMGKDYRVLYPKQNPVTDSEYDLWVHFHGSKLFQTEWVKEMRKTVLVTLHQRGLSGVYLERFKMPYQWRQVREKVSQAVSEHYETEANPRRVGLSGWSAGCAAVQRITDFDMSNIDGMILLDGVHGTYRGPNNEIMRDYSRFRHAASLPVNLPDYSLLAALGARFMGISHSSIPCSGTCQAGDKSYASTTATARNMIWSVGGTEEDLAYKKTETDDPYAVYNTFDLEGLHVIQRKGADGNAHCRVFDDVPPLLKKAKTEAGFE